MAITEPTQYTKPDTAVGPDDNWYVTFEIGDRIRKVRDLNSMQQSEFAEAIGCARAMVSRWEKNQVVPTLDNVQRISDVFGVSLEWLIRGIHGRSSKIA